MSETDENRVVEVGAWGTVEYAVRKNGSMPARKYLEKLKPKEQMKLAALFKEMADHGRIWNEGRFRSEQGSLWTFKAGSHRIPCFRIGSRWILTHGFEKRRRRWPQRETKKALKIEAEHRAHAE